MDIQRLRYPIGTLNEYRNDPSRSRASDIALIESLPGELEDLFPGFTSSLWDTPYRTEGWTGRQVVHHMADSHMNAFCRLKLILTEDRPVVKPYDENSWVRTADSCDQDPVFSLHIIKGLHPRMAKLISSAKEDDWKRVCYHPEQEREMSFEELVTLYAWHGKHHLGHLRIILGEL